MKGRGEGQWKGKGVDGHCGASGAVEMGFNGGMWCGLFYNDCHAGIDIHSTPDPGRFYTPLPGNKQIYDYQQAGLPPLRFLLIEKSNIMQ